MTSVTGLDASMSTAAIASEGPSIGSKGARRNEQARHEEENDLAEPGKGVKRLIGEDGQILIDPTAAAEVADEITRCRSGPALCAALRARQFRVPTRLRSRGNRNWERGSRSELA